MAKARQSELVASTAFPLYAVRMVGERHFVVAGGGGQAKTGIPNAMELYSLKRDQGMCVVEKVQVHDTGDTPIMNCTVAPDGKNYVLAAGQGDSCQLYKLSYKVVVPKVEGQVLEGVRKRKGNLTESEAHKNAEKQVTFDVVPLKKVQTDFHKDGGFQKAVHFTKDLSVLVTGGADGKLRVWNYQTFKKLYEVKAHTNEIDDLDISPAGDKITTVSRDNHAYVWNTKDGSKFIELNWPQQNANQYRYRGCRYSIVVDKKDETRLFTMHIPSTRGSKPLACYLSKWDPISYRHMTSMATGTEILSSMAVSDEGVYLGAGTIQGSVSVYIAFSLQRLYHIKGAHNIFVTGVEFTNSSQTCRAITGDFDCTLLSISADNQVKIHQVSPRTETLPVINGLHLSPYHLTLGRYPLPSSSDDTFNALWIVAGFVIVIYFVFWFISAFGL